MKKFIQNLQDWQNRFEVKDYEFEKYDCEIANLYKSAKENHYNLEYSKECLETWRGVFAKEFFELSHPIHNHIKTRAIANVLHPNFHLNYIFFADVSMEHLWLCLQIHGICDCFVTRDGVYIAPVPVINAWRGSVLGRIRQVLPLIDDINEIYYKDIPSAIVFDNVRPFHAFADDVDWFLRLKLANSDKAILNSKAFFIAQNINAQRLEYKKYCSIAPRLHWNPDLPQSTRSFITKECLKDFNHLVATSDKLDRFDKVQITSQDLENLTKECV